MQQPAFPDNIELYIFQPVYIRFIIPIHLCKQFHLLINISKPRDISKDITISPITINLIDRRISDRDLARSWRDINRAIDQVTPLRED